MRDYRRTLLVGRAAIVAAALTLSACQEQRDHVLTDAELATVRQAARDWGNTWDADVVLVAPIDFSPPDGTVLATVKPREPNAQPISLRCRYVGGPRVCIRTPINMEDIRGRQ